MTEAFCPHKKAIARNFSRRAESYDQAAVVQQEIGARLIERLPHLEFTPKRILDLGAGTGHFTHSLAKSYPNSHIVHYDLSYGMVEYAKRKFTSLTNLNFLCGDGEYLPFQNNYFDLIFSNCTLQWFQDQVSIFSELNRVLASKGHLLFTTFGPDTLKELRDSFLEIDNQLHVNHFTDMHDIGDILLNLKYQNVIVDMETICLQYAHFKALIQDLKTTGGNYVFREKPLHYTQKSFLLKLKDALEKYRNSENLLPLTFEVIFGYAIKQEQVLNSSDEINIPLSKIKYT